ncbi:unnamed protein product, partial [Ixodes pacificus]
ISTREFLSLLRTYLGSLNIKFEENVYTQKEGICIGSCIAPALCDLYMAKGNRELQGFFQENGVSKCFRYVDDFLVCFPIHKLTDKVRSKIMEKFREAHKGLEFTYELPEKGSLQFLDINMTFEYRHTCWMYQTRGEKRILPYDSGHTKLVKRSVASGCMWQAIQKSCHHKVSESLQRQTSRLHASDSDYPEPILVAVAEKCISTLTRSVNPRRRSWTKDHW